MTITEFLTARYDEQTLRGSWWTSRPSGRIAADLDRPTRIQIQPYQPMLGRWKP